MGRVSVISLADYNTYDWSRVGAHAQNTHIERLSSEERNELKSPPRSV